MTRAGEYLGIAGHLIGESIRSLVSPGPADLARKMAGQRLLSLRVTLERIEITPTDARYRTEAALNAIVQAVPHFAPSGETYRPYSKSERRRWRSYGYGEMLGKGHPMWSVPIVFERGHPYQAGEQAAFDALVEKLRAYDRPVSLPELHDAAEAAYLSTRPDDFNFHHYYA